MPPRPVDVSVTKEETVKKEVVQTVPEAKPEPVKEEKKGFLGGLFKKHKKANADKAEDKEQ